MADALKNEDRLLIAKALENPQDFSAIVLKYQNPLGRYVRRLGGLESDDIKDVLQNVFVNAYKALNSVDIAGTTFSAWLYRIAHNETVSYLRRKSAKATVPLPEEDEGKFPYLASDLDVQEEISKKIDSEEIHKAVSSLPDKYREVVILKYFEDKNYDEISDILKKPPGTIATLISRAKARLRVVMLEKEVNQTK